MWQKAKSLPLTISTALILGSLMQTEANAITTYTEKVTCPLNGKTTEEMKYGSYNFVGRRLDTKAILLGYPQVLPLPVCKENGFVIYKKAFEKEELKKARDLVNSAEFKIASKIHTNHYMAAIEAEYIGESHFEIAHLYLIASWEVEESGFEVEESKIERTRDYMAKSLKHFSLFLKSHNDQDDRWWFAQLISANFERKLAKFQDAIERIKRLPIETLNNKSRAYLMAKKIQQLSERGNMLPKKM